MPVSDDVDGRIDDQHDAEIMMKDHEPPKRATVSAMRSPKVDSSSMTSLAIAAGAAADELLRGMKLAAQDGEHVHAGVRLAFEQRGDVVAIDFEAGGFFDGHGVGLVGVCSSMEAKPKNSPWPGSSTTTS